MIPNAPPSRRWFHIPQPAGQWETHYLLACNVNIPRPNPELPPDLNAFWLDTPADPAFASMVRIAAEQGLDESWCREQLEAGDACVLAMVGTRPIGMGLVTCREFWVEEILHGFDPCPEGCYLYATYVSPAHRGRRVQRLLDIRRLRWAAAMNLRWCYAIVESSNIPSLRSHLRTGFRRSLRIDRLRLGRLSLFHLRRLTPTTPAGILTHAGFPPSALLHVIPTRFIPISPAADCARRSTP